MIVLVNGEQVPTQKNTIDIDDSIGQRSTASFAVVDKAAGYTFKRGQNVEILDMAGELVENPETLKTDFANKVQGSSVENPNEVNYSNASSLPGPDLINKKHSQSAIDKVKTLNGDLLSYASNTIGAFAADMFSFNLYELIKRKYGFNPSLNWLRENLEYIKLNWHGRGFNKWGDGSGKTDYTSKVTASTTANPNIMRFGTGSSILTPQTAGTEATQANYDNVKTQNNTSFSTSITTNGQRSQHIFTFNLIEYFKRKYGFDVPGADLTARVTWLRSNVKRLEFNHYGFGQHPGGNEVFLYVYEGTTASSLKNYLTGFQNSATVQLSQFGVYPDKINEVIDSNGFVVFAAAAKAANGTTASVINTDHVFLDVVLEAGNEKATLSTWENGWKPKGVTTAKDTYDFSGKIRNSSTVNPHIARVGVSSNLSDIKNAPFSELTQTDYNRIITAEGSAAYTSTTTSNLMAQHTFSFDVLTMYTRKYGAIPGATTADKITWLRKNITNMKFTWLGYGQIPGGFKASLCYAKNGFWYVNGSASDYSHTFASVSKLFIEPSASFLPAVIDDNGYAHFLAYAPTRSDGVSANAIFTDHAYFEIEGARPNGQNVVNLSININKDIPIASDGFVHFLANAEATVYANGPSTIETDFIELEYKLKPKFIPPGAKIFGGVIERPLTKDINLARDYKLHSITCADWHYFADKRVVAKVYRGMYAGDIVRDIIANFLADEGIKAGDIQQGPFVTEAVYNYVFATRCFESLAELAAFEWHIDDDKYLNFFSRSTFYAPINITPTSQIRNIELEPSAEDYRNKQYIRAGRDVTDPITEQYKGDGATRTYTFPYDLAKEPTVKVDGVNKTVGIRGLEEGFDFYWSKGDKVVSQDDSQTPLTSSQTLSVIGQGFFDIVISSSNYSEIGKMKEIEGGSGLHENVLDDSSISSKQSAFETANAKLKRYSTMGNKLRFETLIPNLRAGQLININLPSFKVVDTDFLIESVKSAELGTDDNRMLYQVDCIDGAATGGWGAFFKKMSGTEGAFSIRENIQESESVIIMLNFSKTWTQGEGKNIFVDIYPKAGLYPSASFYPGFDDDDRVKYVSFFDVNNVELFRKSVVKQTESEPGVIETTAIILPFEANGLPIKHIGWYGGDKATSSLDTGILIDKQPFDRVKNDAESFQIIKTDFKGW